MLSDKCSQLVVAEKELQLMIKSWDIQKLKDFFADRGIKWRFRAVVPIRSNFASANKSSVSHFAVEETKKGSFFKCWLCEST